MFAYSFLAMTAYNILKPISKGKFISSFGADNVPYIQLIAGAIIGVIMLSYAWGAARLPRKAVIPATLATLAALVFLFWSMFKLQADWVAAAFFVFNLMLGILLISQFWTLANDVYDPRQARRIFGFIGGGASLGGAMGSGITSWSVAHLGVDNLLLVSAVAIAMSAAVVTVIVRRQPLLHQLSGVAAVEEGVGLGEALRLLSSSRHLQIISIVIAFAAIGNSIIDQQLNMAAAAEKGSDTKLVSFLAEITFYLSLAGFVVQVGLTRLVHRSFGLVFALLVLPVSLGSTAVAILATGSLWAPSVAKVLDSSLRYSLDKTTREILFLPLPPDLKLRAKAFVDVTVDRIAKAAGNVLALVLIKPWGFGFDWVRLSYASLAMMVIWIAMALVARREYLASFLKSLDRREIEPDTVRINVADPATIEALVEELANPDEAAVLYAIEMLETLDKRHLITPLLLHHESSRVRARALTSLRALRHAKAERWLPAVRAMLKDDDADVRAAAVRALADIGDEDVGALLHRHLDDTDPRVVITAAVELADSGTPGDPEAAERALSRLIGDTRSCAAGGRRDAAGALAHIKNPSFRWLLVPLIHDRDPSVARKAITSACAMGPSDAIFVPALVSLLGNRLLKDAARDTLESYGHDVVPVLTYLLADTSEQPWVRRHIPATLARIPSQASMNALVQALSERDGFLRFKVVDAIGALRRRSPELTFNTDAIEHLIHGETARYYTYLTLRYNIVTRDPEGARTLVVRALDDKLKRTLDRIYRELMLLYPWKDVAAARRTIEGSDPHARANAVEFLDTLMTGTVRKRVTPIVEDMPLADRVRHANSVLKTRPRDLEDTLARLVHDDDPVLAASAIHLVARRGLTSLATDLEFLINRGTADPMVLGAATWAHETLTRRDAVASTAAPASLQVVAVADRLRAIQLFEFVSVDELFRVASTARQTRYERGHVLASAGQQPADVFFVLEGTAELSGGGADIPVTAPAAPGFEDLLVDRPVSQTLTATSPGMCVTFSAAEFLTMMADNIAMAQGLFQMFLADREAAVMAPVGRVASVPAGNGDQLLNPIDRALLLRQNPYFGNASVAQLIDLAAVTRLVPIATGSELMSEGGGPAMYHVLHGDVRLQNGDGNAHVAGAGSTLFLIETLAGRAPKYRAVASHDGHVLRLDHDDLFEVLSEHFDLLQGVFGGVLNTRR